MLAFKNSLAMLPSVRYILEEMQSELLQTLYQDLDPLEDLCQSDRTCHCGRTTDRYAGWRNHPGGL